MYKLIGYGFTYVGSIGTGSFQTSKFCCTRLQNSICDQQLRAH